MLRLPGEDLPEMDAMGIMLTFQDIESRQDEYDFPRVGAVYDHWRRRSKSPQLRMSTASLILGAPESASGDG